MFISRLNPSETNFKQLWFTLKDKVWLYYECNSSSITVTYHCQLFTACVSRSFSRGRCHRTLQQQSRWMAAGWILVWDISEGKKENSIILRWTLWTVINYDQHFKMSKSHFLSSTFSITTSKSGGLWGTAFVCVRLCVCSRRHSL